MRQYAPPVSALEPVDSNSEGNPAPETEVPDDALRAKRGYRRNADGTPVLRKHHSGRAFVRIAGKDYACGKYGTPEATAEYRRMVSEHALTGRVTPRKPSNQRAPESISINELALGFWRNAKETYGVVPTNTPRWTECVRIRLAIKSLIRLYGYSPAADFGPQQLVVLQKALIKDGLSLKTVNDRIAVIRRGFRWGVAQGFLPGTILPGLDAVENLRAGRTTAKPPRKVKPVPDADIEEVRQVVSPQIRALIDLQLLTGARPGELVRLRPKDIHRSAGKADGGVWTATLEDHKTAHLGKEPRVIMFGPQAQAILAPFMFRGDDAFLFSPAEAEKWRHEEARANRKTRVQPSQQKRNEDRRLRQRKRPPSDQYDVATYRRAIKRAVGRINEARRAESTAAGVDPVLMPAWHPHQLRHNAATNLRKQFGAEMARIILGHHSLKMTEVYAERDLAAARQVMGRVG